ncbi:hypothetical protein LOK49_LG08G00166 [Camellia lanceoleosa]|uniref:Uncharacterized protein n=1 Tax=Camellia lanceoleosa TaxID=1840588 RepID=A0ACC0GR52_9ERIC|nr:hypothetical protein LOK49_LG08G00166 [Camellia lanceoleosa]
MGVVDFHSMSSSICMIKSASSYKPRCCSFGRNQSGVTCMASTIPIQQVKEEGCGADELVDLIMRCVLDPGDKIVDCPLTFTMYEFDAAVNGELVIKVPRKLDFSLDVELITEVVEQEKPKN